METAAPVANSQLPESSILPFTNPVQDDVAAQEIFTAISFPVVAVEPPIVKAPEMSAFPDAVSTPSQQIVERIVRVAPESMVRFLHTPVVPYIHGCLTGSGGMTTSSPGIGICPRDQLAPIPQDTLEEPSQTLVWEKELVVASIINTSVNRTMNCFMD